MVTRFLGGCFFFFVFYLSGYSQTYTLFPWQISQEDAFWLKSRSFDITSYNGNNSKTNEYLNLGLQYNHSAKKGRNTALIGGVIVLGGIVSSMALFLNSQRSDDRVGAVILGTVFGISGGITGIVGLIKSSSHRILADSSIEKAKQSYSLEGNKKIPNSDSIKLQQNITTAKYTFSHPSFYSQDIVKVSDTRWLIKHHFDTDTYTWDNEQVNLRLKQAVKRKKTGNILLYSSLGTLVLGTVFVTRENLDVKILVPISFVICAIGITERILAKSSVRKANNIRHNTF